LQREIRGDVKVQHLNILLKLALNSPDPVTYIELEKWCDTTKASVSRNLKLLGTLMDQSGKDQGLGLVDIRINPFSTREYIVELTPKGVDIIKKLNKVMEG